MRILPLTDLNERKILASRRASNQCDFALDPSHVIFLPVSYAGERSSTGERER